MLVLQCRRIDRELVYPPYNEVFRKATHNSYWVNGSSIPTDPLAAGPQQRVLDQALYEHVRAFEFDLHFKSGHAGEFDVYHTDNQDNSTCYALEDCLDLMRRIDYVLPNHELINIILEFKEIGLHLFGDLPLQGHHPPDIDRLLWERLGPRLYTPREFLERCPPGATLRQCASANGWPTTDELRGRYIVNVIGNYLTFNSDAYADYVGDDGGVPNRAAFPLRSVLSADADDPAACVGRCALLRGSEIFWQVENTGKPEISQFLADGGVVRSKAAHMLSDPIPAGKSDDVGSISQDFALSRGYQLIMTDYEWNFINDVRRNVPGSFPWPSLVNRPFFEAADVIPGASRQWKEAALTEPGNRIYFNTTNRFVEADRIDPGSGTRETDPTKMGHAEAFIDQPEGPARERSVEDWEVFPSTTMISHGAGPQNDGTPGDGCFVARSFDSRNEVDVCRVVETNGGRDVAVHLTVRQNGQVKYEDRSKLHKNVVRDQSLGDAFRVRLTRLIHERATIVEIWTANSVAPDGSMEWVRHPVHSALAGGSDIRVGGLLSRQGLAQWNDGVFTGTKLNGADVTLPQFNTKGHAVVDLSWCVTGSCRQSPRPTHETIRSSTTGTAFVGVHETEGRVFGQWRTLYTTDRFEVATSGLYQFQNYNKFLLMKDDPPPGAPFVQLFRCVDWRRFYHQHWLSIDPSCPNPNTKEAYAQNAGRMGYIATKALAGTQPLWHLRKGTHNDGSADTHDHYFAVGNAQRDTKIQQEGYGLVGNVPVGFVYTDGSLP
jgi:hypothetical protein